jgi:hypothetical protein
MQLTLVKQIGAACFLRANLWNRGLAIYRNAAITDKVMTTMSSANLLARQQRTFASILLLAVLGLSGCASESSDGTASAVREPPTSPTSPPTSNSPVISGTPTASVQATTAYSFTPTASDPNNDPLTFSITNRPAWATFNTTTGRLSGTPTATGTFSNIVITVTDGANSASLPSFAIQVTGAPNRAPTISGTPPSAVQIGTAYTFTPAAADADGNALTFTFSGLPTWLTGSASNGRITGTPAVGQDRLYSNIFIRVSDGMATTSLGPFSINVTALPSTNQPPVISGTPPTSIVAGLLYSFTPTASDPNAGSTLTFSITNRPLWTTFDPVTGTLTGLALFGISSNIVISVRDPEGATAALQPFSINVSASPPTGTATVSWTPPTTNTDDTPLTNLAGFRVLYGTNANSLNQQVQVAGATATSRTINALASGTWYFAVRAYNAAGAESDLSNVASKIIP